MNLGFFKEFMPYGLLSVIVLVIFYGIYYTKMIIQKRQGIKTKQIGSRKEKKVTYSRNINGYCNIFNSCSRSIIDCI